MTPAIESPLHHIERAVQMRAKHAALDVTTDAGLEALRSLIEEEVGRWDDDARRGVHATTIADRDDVTRRAWRNLIGHGPLTELLTDPDVWEIEVNSPQHIFVKRHRGPSGYHHESFHDDEHVLRTLTRLVDDSSRSHRRVDPTEGLQDAQLDDGSRLHIVHADVARSGHTMVNIRRFTGVPYASLHELVACGTLTNDAANFLADSVRGGASVLISGAPGSGKTTLLSCCLAELAPTKRVVTAEEVFEIDAPLPNVASMQTRAARADRPAIDLRRLVAGFLRMAPDIAVVGEVRDREALPLLLTLSSGITGFTTIHASSARNALTRLRFLAQLSEASTLPGAALTSLVSETIDLVVFSRRGPQGPVVTQIVAVEDFVGGPDSTAFTTTDLFARRSDDGPLERTGLVPQRLSARYGSHVR